MQQDSYNLIAELTDLIENSKSGFKNMKQVDGNVALELLRDLQLRIQEDYSQCQKIVTERENIIQNARDMAMGIENDARERARQLTEENNITVQANHRAKEIEEQAVAEARRIVAEAGAESDRIRKETEADLENKKMAARTYINTRLEVADRMLDNARRTLDAACGDITDKLDDIRKLHGNLLSMDAPSFMNAGNND